MTKTITVDKEKIESFIEQFGAYMACGECPYERQCILPNTKRTNHCRSYLRQLLGIMEESNE